MILTLYFETDLFNQHVFPLHTFQLYVYVKEEINNYDLKLGPSYL